MNATVQKFREAIYSPSLSLAERLDVSEVVEAARAGRVLERVETLYSRDDFARALGAPRLRTTVDNTQVVVPQWTKDVEDLPWVGGRLPSVFRVRPAPNPAVGVSEETGTPSAVSTATDDGVALPEAAVTFQRIELPPASRFGAFIPAWKSVLDDSQELADAVRMILERDVARRIDFELIAGDGSGTALGTRLTGLANQSLSTQSATGTSRWETLVAAATTIRSNNWTAPITHLLHPTDFKSLVTEKAATTNAPVFADAEEALDALDADYFVISPLLTQGTGYTLAGNDFGTIYVREPVTLSVSQDHASFFIQGLVALKVETRLAFRKHHTSAAVQITNL